MFTFEAAEVPVELEEVVELADEWLSELLILLRNLSNSEIFLSEIEVLLAVYIRIISIML